ncbi:DHA2 family efflux MFS transporter permease subunit [Bacillus sp. EB01]|uniref:DHA2 family efflux MFS transporter permease subunit n=1 Tax=Bacillus sp. EB01 TaxID=1347086 RepID=UPI0005C5B8CE|nr:DHA2 family efflux MFS transporter permease subunit [Bacillus sp. EB01]
MYTSKPINFNRTTIVSLLLAASFVSLLNQTLLIVAIPPIMAEFGIEPNEAQWVTTAFMLMNGIMIPITAFLIEKFGTKSLLIFAMSVFSFGTLLGAISTTFMVLLIARVLQAIGAGILMPLMQTVLLTLYPPEKRGAAMGMSGLVIGFAPAIGPTLSGWIIDHFTWRYLFYTVLPISLIVLVLAVFLMKNVTEKKQVRVDVHSIILSSFGWGGLLYGFSMVGSMGWLAPTVIGSIILGIAALVFFIKRQNRLESPILNFSVFKYREFTVTTFLSVLMFALLIGIETLLPLYVQNVRGGTALESGMLLLPGAILTGAMAPISGRLFDKFGARGMAILGFVFIFLSTLLYMTIGMETPFQYIAVLFSLQMFGVSLLMTPLMTSGINALPFQLIPHGTAMSNTIRMVGGSIGTSLIFSVMSVFARTSSESLPPLALLDGMRVAFMVAGVMALAGLLFAFTLAKGKLVRLKG